ncbi:unnamed protein product [Prorocentrum cordatum]|nr:unnamed protein product [Polarella glacialis]
MTPFCTCGGSACYCPGTSNPTSCNGSPFAGDDRCVCGPKASDWVPKSSCTPWPSPTPVPTAAPTSAPTPALLPCQEGPGRVTTSCAGPSQKCFFDPSCSTAGGVGCNAGGVGLNCRFCDTGGGAPACPASLLEAAGAGQEATPAFWPTWFTCAVGATVQCPGSTSKCAGDQCCAGFASAPGATFPCPSASRGFSGCVNNTKVADCLPPLEEAQVREGEQCGSSGSTGHFYGFCADGLVCVPPAAGSPPGAPSICHRFCGSFGSGGHRVNGSCADGQTCSGSAALPCLDWAAECYLYCM